MPSFRIPLVLPMLLCALVACTATPPTEAQAPGPDATNDRATTAMPPPGASGKLSPEMVGKVSPVPAFRGLGEHFNIEIQSRGEPTAEGLAHHLHLIWGSGSFEAEGTLFYRGTPGPSRGTPILLDGTLNTTKGKKAIRVEIVTEPCTDDADVAHPQRVKVAIQGGTDLNGCGELAVY
jgi:hypothetical protein